MIYPFRFKSNHVQIPADTWIPWGLVSTMTLRKGFVNDVIDVARFLCPLEQLRFLSEVMDSVWI
jgi:hypothetical protein